MNPVVLRISRLISLITIIVWIYCGYYIYDFMFIGSWGVENGDIDAYFQSFYNLWYTIIIATLILLIFNYVAFGKISVWIKGTSTQRRGVRSKVKVFYSLVVIFGIGGENYSVPIEDELTKADCTSKAKRKDTYLLLWMMHRLKYIQLKAQNMCVFHPHLKICNKYPLIKS